MKNKGSAYTFTKTSKTYRTAKTFSAGTYLYTLLPQYRMRLLLFFILLSAWACVALTASTWEKMPSMAYKRSDYGITQMASDVYISGGCISDQATTGYCTALTNHFTVFNFATQAWATLPDMPQSRFRHCTVIANNKLYVIGGRDVSDAFVASVIVYDLTDKTWSTLTSAQASISDHACWNIGNKIYYTGGYSSDYTTIYATTFVLDTGATSPAFQGGVVPDKPTKTGDSNVAYVNGLVYVLGGFATTDFAAPVATVDVYDIVTNKWTTTAPMIKARGDAGIAIIDGYVFVAGGETKVNGVSTPVNDVEVYSPSKKAWIDCTSLAESRFRFHSANNGNYLYNFGGQGAAANNVWPALSDVYRLDVSEYVRVASPAGRSAPGLSVMLSFLAAATVLLML